MQCIESLCKNIKWCSLNYADTCTNKRQKLIDVVKSFYEEKNRWPTTKEITDKHPDIKKNHFRGSTSMNIIKFDAEKSLHLRESID
jgi:hypothetical protein